MIFPGLSAHGFLGLAALWVRRIRRHEAIHAAGLHGDDAHGDATQTCTAHDDGLTPALQVPENMGKAWQSEVIVAVDEGWCFIVFFGWFQYLPTW